MLKTFRTIHIDIDFLNEFELPCTDKPFILCVNENNVKYEFLIKLNLSKKMLVLGSGAYDSNKIQLPVFQRYTWIDDFDDVVIYYNDPTLYLDKINIGWGVGFQEKHYIETIYKIIESISKKLFIENNNIVFYGSSAAGFMSMMLATLLKGSTALVNNPQTFVYKFWESHYSSVMNTSFPQMDIEQALKKFFYRLDIIEFFKRKKYIPHIRYLQNIACEHDMITQFNPFMKNLESLGNILINEVEFVLYYNQELGHNPLPKEETLLHINESLNRRKN